MVRRSGGKERILQVRPDELSRAASLLRPAAFRMFVWPELVGVATARRACEHHLCLDDIEVRAAGRTKREPHRSAGHGHLSGIRLLRALRNSRSVAAIILNHVHPGTAW